jgi:transposase-like protein
MRKDKQEAGIGLPGIRVSLDELVRRGARQVIQQVIELELAALLEQYANVRTLSGKQAVVRNGYLPERDVLTAAGPVAVRVPKVRDRSRTGVKFNSALVPPYVRKSPRVSAALPGCTSRASPPGTSAKRCRCCWATKPGACRPMWSAA